MVDGLNGVIKEKVMKQEFQRMDNKIDNFLPKNGDLKLDKEIIADLISTSKKISCVLFYDEVGSKLFEDITKLPEYYLTRTEIGLLKQVAIELNDKLRDVDIVEFGSGESTKISILLESIPKEYRKTICYVPVDVSEASIKKSSDILLKKFPGIRMQGIVADFNTQLLVIPKETKKIFCFLGSTIGNFSIDEALRFLVDLSHIMNSGDLLLLGFDMVKSIDIIEKAYNDSKKVTEEFNKNILNVVNNHIGTNFDPNLFEHIAFYNEDFSRIEMHLKAIKDQVISSPNLAVNILIKKGEMIHTENSYKFTEQNIKDLANGAGFEIQKIFTDENKWFSLVQLIKK
jgi:L-histidine N-alpha-methyltransferase